MRRFTTYKTARRTWAIIGRMSSAKTVDTTFITFWHREVHHSENFVKFWIAIYEITTLTEQTGRLWMNKEWITGFWFNLSRTLTFGTFRLFVMLRQKVALHTVSIALRRAVENLNKMVYASFSKVKNYLLVY